jgi:hypothetical protein
MQNVEKKRTAHLNWREALRYRNMLNWDHVLKSVPSVPPPLLLRPEPLLEPRPRTDPPPDSVDEPALENSSPPQKPETRSIREPRSTPGGTVMMGTEARGMQGDESALWQVVKKQERISQSRTVYHSRHREEATSSMLASPSDQGPRERFLRHDPHKAQVGHPDRSEEKQTSPQPQPSPSPDYLSPAAEEKTLVYPSPPSHTLL